MENERRQSPSVEIRLFGTFQILVNGEPIPALRSRQGQALFGLLVLRHTVDSDRDTLAFALWPDSSEAQARYNLRRNLTDLRRALGAESRRLLSPSPRSLRFDVAGASVDVATFDAAVSSEKREDWENAAALYHGELLPGCDAVALTEERRRREQAYFDLLEKLANDAAERDPGKALMWLRRLIAADPLRETACRALMTALSRRGELAAVTEAYRDFRLYLRREMNAEPAPETVALYETLQKEMRSVSARIASTDDSFVVPPCSLSPLIGRESEVVAIIECLKTTRLLTLTGAGGIGKTRLAAAVGDQIAAEGEKTGGVELAPLLEAAQVPFAIAATLRLSERPGEPIAQRLTDFIGAKKLLLILDNCEHLRDGCAEWAGLLLKSCPNLRLLATSRQPLGLFEEANWRVPSLPLLGSPPRQTEEDLLQFGAVPAIRLFVERARAALHTFRLTHENAADIAHICAELDGIPLALELAAVWVGSLSVSQIAGRLDNQFALLHRGDRTASPRHQTLRNTMDWSYALLQPDEQRLLARLAVFAGGWMLEEAEAICSGGQNGPILSPLSQLAEKSLVETREEKGLLRYRLLEPVRQYAQERLVETGEAAAMQRRHLRFFLERAERVAPALGRAETVALLDAMATDYPHYRKAFHFCFSENSDATDQEVILLGLRLSIALSAYQIFRGLFEEGRQMLETALSHSETCSAPDLRAKAQSSLGTLLMRRGEIDAARASAQTAGNYYREQLPSVERVKALYILGVTYLAKDDYPKAKALLEEGLTLCDEIGEQTVAGQIQVALGNIAKMTGDYSEAQHLMENAIRHFQQEGWLSHEGVAQHNLGNVFREGGDPNAAERRYERSLQIHQQMENRAWMGINLVELTSAEYDRKNWEAAHRLGLEALPLCHAGNRTIEPQCLDLLAEITRQMKDLIAARDYKIRAITLHYRLGVKRSLAFSLWGMSQQLYEEGHFARSVQLLTAFIHIREQIGFVFRQRDLAPLAEDLQKLQNAIGAAAFAKAQAAGQAMSLEQAVAFALEVPPA